MNLNKAHPRSNFTEREVIPHPFSVPDAGNHVSGTIKDGSGHAGMLNSIRPFLERAAVVSRANLPEVIGLEVSSMLAIYKIRKPRRSVCGNPLL
jgi:hypothetical protein